LPNISKLHPSRDGKKKKTWPDWHTVVEKSKNKSDLTNLLARILGISEKNAAACLTKL